MKHFIKRTISLMLVAVMLILSLLLGGCSLFNQGVEDGFKENTFLYGKVPDFMVAYTSEIREYDIDNFNLMLYYGYYNMPDWYNEKVPILLNIYCEGDDQRIILKRYEFDEFFTENREVSVKRSFVSVCNYIFDYCEMVTIPSEVFTKDKGRLVFSLDLEYLPENKHVKRTFLNGICLDYEIKDNKVIISRANTFTFTIGDISFKFWR